MSVSPRQNFLKPPPVPEMPTVTLTLPLVDLWKSSATASVIGNTVLEPSIFTSCAWAGAGQDRRADAGEHQRRAHQVFEIHLDSPVRSRTETRAHCMHAM